MPPSAPASSPSPVAAPKTRVVWVDHVRTVLIFLVVGIHATIVYSHVGSWYFMHPIEPPVETKIGFLVVEAHLQAFFMGLLFFVSGYFAQFSVQRRGPSAFLRERLVRLGVPLLLYVFLIHPFMVYVMNPWGHPFPPLAQAYGSYLKRLTFLSGTGPLWFVQALLIFCAGLASWHAWRPASAEPSESRLPRITPGRVLLLGLGLGIVSFFVRVWQPIGTNVLNLQLCFFPQYIVAFALGLWMARRRGLDVLAAQTWARRMGWVTLFLGPLVLLAVIWSALPLAEGQEPAFFGGWTLPALGYALWEQCAGVGLSMGVMGWLQAHANRPTPLWTWLSDRSFAVYVLHAPVVVALTLLVRSYYGNPYLLAAGLSLLSLLTSYALADLVRRIPGVKTVL